MRVIIIGNGIAGTNAARHIRKNSDYDVLMISEETLQPFSRTALMYVYMGHLKQENTALYEDWFWGKNRIERKQARVTHINTTAKSIVLNTGESLQYDKLIIATGSKPNKYGWPGQDAHGVQGLYHLQDLETMEQYSKGLQHAVITGGGLIGIEMAEMFHSRHISVTFLVRESSFWGNILPPEESEMINRHIRAHGIDLRLGTELKSIQTDTNNRVKGVITSTEEPIPCGFVGLTVGVSPNIEFLKDSGIETGRGVLTDQYLRTSAPEVYAIGDCAEMRTPQEGRRPIEAVWYTGRMMGRTVAQTICGNPTAYQPGIWFNSAKFFDIEYQVYGDIPARKPDHIHSLYWEHSGGQKAIRINFDRNSQQVTGFNLMGIRYRHEVCERWIAQRTPIREVLKHLSLANFDPEFYKEYEDELVRTYNATFQDNIQPASRRELDFVTQFLKKNV